MKIRAAIFDVYGTLLKVGPPPADAEEQWQHLCSDTFNATAPYNLTEFSKVCDQIIGREHCLARQTGILFPEVFWPRVVTEALPSLCRLTKTQQEEFLFRQAQLRHTVRLYPDAPAVLCRLRKQQITLGIASNAQPYTLRELKAALRTADLPENLFDPELSFWSFAHGFSKPDPHVFRILAARLCARGVLPGEILMVGDRLDNDIAPAQTAGWQTWHLSQNRGETSGNWAALNSGLDDMMCLS